MRRLLSTLNCFLPPTLHSVLTAAAHMSVLTPTSTHALLYSSLVLQKLAV